MIGTQGDFQWLGIVILTPAGWLDTVVKPDISQGGTRLAENIDAVRTAGDDICHAVPIYIGNIRAGINIIGYWSPGRIEIPLFTDGY